MFIYWVEADSLILWNDQIPVDWLRSPASQMQEWKKTGVCLYPRIFYETKKGRQSTHRLHQSKWPRGAQFSFVEEIPSDNSDIYSMN